MKYKRNSQGYFRTKITVNNSDGTKSVKDIRTKDLTRFKELINTTNELKEKNFEFSIKEYTVKEWAEEWLKTFKKPSVTYQTYRTYEVDTHKNIIDYIGYMKLTEVKQYDLQKLLNQFQGMSTSHVNKIKITIEQIFSTAYTNELITKDITKQLKAPQSVKGSNRALTDQERKIIIKTAKQDSSGLWILIMYYCGLRPEETIPLMWSDINLTKGNEELTVKRAICWLHGRPEIKKPKKRENETGTKAERTIPIDFELAELLRKQKHDSLYVFHRPDGEMLWNWDARRMWKQFYAHAKELGLNDGYTLADDLKPYFLRHTCCTRWFELGIDLKTVQYLMGHSDIQTTANIYTHVTHKKLDDVKKIISCGSKGGS